MANANKEHFADSEKIEEITKINCDNVNVKETAEYIISEAFKHAYYSY